MNRRIKVCLYLEFSGSRLVARSGFRTAFQNQKRALESVGVDVVIDPTADHDILHLHGYGPNSFRYLNRAKRAGRAVVVHAHSIGRYDLRDSFNFTTILAPLYEHWLSFYYNRADLILTPSLGAKELLEAFGLTPPIEVVSNCVDVDRLRRSDEKRETLRRILKLERFAVVTAGNVIPRKGVLDFIEVARLLPEYDFVWYGQRWPRALVYHSAMERAIGRGPANLRWPGFVHDIQGALSAGDALLFPSSGETGGMVLLEGAACSLPLIVRDLPEYSDRFWDGQNCLKGRGPGEFTALLRKVAQQPEIRERLAREARSLAEAHSLNKIGERLRDLYTALLA